MEFLIDFILHIDKHLIEIVQDYHTWAYAILFMIIFYVAINNEPDYMPSQKNKQMMETPEQMNHAEMHSSSSQ